jgi:hypothetical protein
LQGVPDAAIPFGLVCEQLLDCGCESLHGCWGDPGIFGVRVRRDASAIGSDERQARGHRLERGDAEGLARIRMDEDVGVREEARQIAGVLDVTEKRDSAGRMFFAICLPLGSFDSVAGDEQTEIAPGVRR